MTDPTGGPDLGMMGADRLINQVRQRLADGRRLPTVPRSVDGLDLDKATKVAKDFEAVFTTQMISQMFKDVPIGMFGGGFGEKIWREHLYNEFGKTMADSSPLGVGKQVLRQILQMQGKQQPEIDMLIEQALPNPLTAAAAHRRQIGPDAATGTTAAETTAGIAARQQAPGETVRERAGTRAVAKAVEPTLTMARIEADQHRVAPTPRDALYDKTPDGRAIPVAGAMDPAPVDPAPMTAATDAGRTAAAIDRSGVRATMTTPGTATPGSATPDTAVPPGAVVHTPLPVGLAARPDAAAAPTGAPVPLFPAAAATEPSVGRSLLAAMKTGNRGIAAGRPMPTTAPTTTPAAAPGADGPPVPLLPARPAALTDLPAQTAAVAGPRTEWGS